MVRRCCDQQGSRTLVTGNEFGAPLDLDFISDQPMSVFQEYAKNASFDGCQHTVSGGRSDEPLAAGNGVQKDGRAELLVIARKDWASSLQCSR